VVQRVPVTPSLFHFQFSADREHEIHDDDRPDCDREQHKRHQSEHGDEPEYEVRDIQHDDRTGDVDRPVQQYALTIGSHDVSAV